MVVIKKENFVKYYVFYRHCVGQSTRKCPYIGSVRQRKTIAGTEMNVPVFYASQAIK